MVMMSHLSDVQEEMGLDRPGQTFYINEKINFVKFLILKFYDSNVEINPDVEWELFRKSRPQTEKP